MLELFGHDEDEKEMRHLLVDFSAISFAQYYGSIVGNEKLEDDESRYEYWRYIMLSRIIEVKVEHRVNSIYLCSDYGSWRVKEFEYYKAARKLKKSEHPEEVDLIVSFMNKLLTEINVLAWKDMKVPSCEGDDILAFLVNELPEEDVKIIMSGDKDMVQLLKVKNTQFYRIQTRELVECENPDIALIKLILGGDTSDGIPNVKSDDDVFIVKEKRQKACGAKGIEKILVGGLDNFLLENTEYRKNYKRNEKLITLSERFIPKKQWQDMKECFENISVDTTSAIKIGNYFQNNNLFNLMKKVNDFIL